MGSGFYSTSTKSLSLRVSFKFPVTDPELDQWKHAFTYVSEALAHATRRPASGGVPASVGVRIGRVEFVRNELGDSGRADIWVMPGNAGHTGAIDGLGDLTADAHIVLGTNALSQPGTLLHELGHYVFGLDEEYSGPGGGSRTCIVPGTPPEDPNSHVHQSGVCIMQVTSNSVTPGATAADWWNGPPPRVTEFCVRNHAGGAAFSHRAAGVDTWQDDTSRNETGVAETCWETILRKGDSTLSPPDGSVAPPAPGSAMPDPPDIVWVERDDMRRFALVLDRSGSMNDAGAIQGVRYAAHTWIDLERLLRNQLAIVSYADTPRVDLSPRLITATEANTAHTIVRNDLDADGRTNITSALEVADDQLNVVLPGPDPASRRIILFSDGVHNEGPPFPGPTIASPGTIVHTLGFGNADQATLEAIKTASGGYIHVTDTLDPNNNELAINNAISEVAAESHSGMLERVRAELGPVEQEEPIAPGSADDLDAIEALTPAEVAARPDLFDHPVLVDAGITRVTFVLNQRSIDGVFLYVLDPTGRPVVPSPSNFAIGDGHVSYSVAPDQPGVWTMRARRIYDRRFEAAPVVLFAFAEHPTLTTTVTGTSTLYDVKATPELRAYAQNPYVLGGVTVRIWPDDDPLNVQTFTERKPGQHHFRLPEVDRPDSVAWVVEFSGDERTEELREEFEADNPDLPPPSRPGTFRRIKRFQIHYGPLSEGEDTDPARPRPEPGGGCGCLRAIPRTLVDGAARVGGVVVRTIGNLSDRYGSRGRTRG